MTNSELPGKECKNILEKKAYWPIFQCIVLIISVVYWLIYPFLIYYAGLVYSVPVLMLFFLLSCLMLILFFSYCAFISISLLIRWKKLDYRHRLSRLGISILALLILVLAIHNHGQWQLQYLRGSEKRISSRIDISAIHNWIAELNISPEDSYLTVDLENAPPFIKKLKPWRIHIEERCNDDRYSYRVAEFQWRSIGVLELSIGPAEREVPEWVKNKALVLAPGAYLYNLAK